MNTKLVAWQASEEGIRSCIVREWQNNGRFMCTMCGLSGKITDITQIKRHFGTPKHMSYKIGTWKRSDSKSPKKPNLLCKWLENPLLESWLQPHPSNPLSFNCKLCCPDSFISCAEGKGHLESHAKMHGLGIENKVNEVADDIDYGAANIDINDDLGNFILPEGLPSGNRTKVAELRFAALIAQTVYRVKKFWNFW